MDGPAQIPPAEENKNIDGFDNPDKSPILSDQKVSLIEVEENSGGSLVETKPSLDKQESHAELLAKDMNVATSARKKRKRRRQTSLDTDPLIGHTVNAIFDTFQLLLQYKEENHCDDMESDEVLQKVKDGILTKDILHQKLTEHCEQQEMKQKMIPGGK